MDFGNILGKVKDTLSDTAEIQKLVDQLPENIRSKVEPLIKKVTDGDPQALSKAVDALEKYKDNDTVKKILAKLKK